MRKLGVVLTVLVASVVTGCSDDANEQGSPTSAAGSTEVASTVTDSGTPPISCGASEPEVPAVEPIEGIESDLTLTSFDGTQLRIHWFPARDVTEPVATLLEGPGWGLAGSTDTGTGTGLFGDLSVGSLRDAGYNVLTWDPRGFGESDGTITVNDPAREGRDVQRLLDWVATQPEVLLDAPGDPRVGMLGGSYGGGIALIGAAIDCRVDAIAPSIAWNSLSTSLYKGEIAKTGWGNLLFEAANGRDLDPHIVSAHDSGERDGTISSADAEWFASRGPGDELINQIDVPTLLIQGTVDTLFTLDEGVANFELLRGRGVPTAMLWFCGGHGACLTEVGSETWTGAWTMHWFDRYLRGNEQAPLPPTFVSVDQHGDFWQFADLPTATATLVGAGSGSLELVATGGAGPAAAPTGGAGVIGGLALEFTPGRAEHAVEVTITADAEAMIIGAPTLSLTYSGSVDDGDRPTRVFAQLVDDATGRVLGNQITPVVVELDGSSHSLEIPLETVAHRLMAGESVTLQLVATTTAYAQPRLGGSVDFTDVRVELPVVAGATAFEPDAPTAP